MTQTDLHALSAGYPANHFAYRRILPLLQQDGARSVLEIGVGHGGAVDVLASIGLELSGIDIDAASVAATRDRLLAAGISDPRVLQADVRDVSAYADLIPDGGVDALFSFGVLPHCADEVEVLATMRSLVRPGGRVFVEFRNALFSLVTFNRYTRDLVTDTLLGDVDLRLREAVAADLDTRLRVDLPPASASTARFHVPFEMEALFRSAGLSEVTVHPFHYHPGMPYLEKADPQLFRDESIRLEDDDSGWRGLFLCSAFMVHAVVPPES